MSDARKRKAKARLREEIRARRDATTPEERAAAAEAIAERLVTILAGHRLVMLFLSFGTELPTDVIIGRLAGEHHEIAVPHMEAGELVPVSYEPGEALNEVVWGIREPASLRPVDHHDLDAVITPGLAFDREGFRVGYGGGFYDRFFQRIPTDTPRIGIGFSWQLVDEVPRDEHDRRLTSLVTETGVLSFAED
jgi:5-formyltetrahydrofolate cyclo-ligase